MVSCDGWSVFMPALENTTGFIERKTKVSESTSLLARVWSSSLGKKYIMALSGVALFGFVVAHMIGNLMVFLGPEGVNAYGHFLQTTPELLWPARIFLLTMLGLHFVSAALLTLENRSSRPVSYVEYDVVASSFAARTMIYSGLIVLFFVLYHILHFTMQVPGVNLTGQDFHTFKDAKEHHDIYRMIVTGFSHPIVSLAYLVGVGLLCVHLSHGLSSMFQSLGWRKQYYRGFLDKFAVVAAVVIFLGYASIPVAVWVGALKMP